MSKPSPYEDAIDLLDADHKAVKKFFIDYNALCDDGADPRAKQQLAQQICQALIVHAQIEEEIFYPQVRRATGDKPLIDEAVHEHAEAKAAIAKIQGMEGGGPDFDDAVKALGKLIDAHVLEEREQIFLEARYAPLDLRGMAPVLEQRKKELKAASAAPSKGTAKAVKPAKPTKEAE